MKKSIELIWQINHSKYFKKIKLLTGGKHVHCLGDSHALSIKFVADNYLWLHTLFFFKIVHGATAMGLANPNSKTNALEIFKKYVNSLGGEENDFLLLLGEVDCGFVIWYRAEKYDLPVEYQFNISLTNYKTFIKEVLEPKANSIIICSTPLPTIIDNQSWGEVANLRREVRTTLHERTNLTIKYNDALKEFCNDNQYYFLNLQKTTLNASTGLVLDEFRNPDKLDHHLNNKSLAPYIRKELINIGYF